VNDYPYADRYAVNRTLPEHGRPRTDVLAEMREMATEEDAFWETGKISGTMYCGDHEHYEFLNEAFGMYAHVNALQRDMCPSQTKYEGEVIAMALDLLHADAVEDGAPAGLVTTGGTGSILHALVAYREHARETRGVTQPNFVKPETGHAAFDKGCHLFGIEPRNVPVDPDTTVVRPEVVAEQIDENTIAIMGSAGNYAYGTIDPIAELAALAVERGVGMHVDACLGGFILPFAEDAGLKIPEFDFRVPGVTTISADTHKYGYAFKGSSTLLFRDKALRNAQYFHLLDWSGGKYMSPGMEGSRSGGLIASTWAAMVSLGRAGYREHAVEIFETAASMMDVVRSHPELRIMGDGTPGAPTFCFSFTSDEFEIYHLVDFLGPKGWRFNGQQYPNAIHMAVTRPQTRAGVVDAFAADLADAVAYAHEKHAAGEEAFSGAIYGGVAGGLDQATSDFIVMVMDDMLDKQQALPPAP
jgi:glutamate/tyrosine decarboxylase-like PLP-dependent enzyme